jgi:hypothetical protein
MKTSWNSIRMLAGRCRICLYVSIFSLGFTLKELLDRAISYRLHRVMDAKVVPIQSGVLGLALLMVSGEWGRQVVHLCGFDFRV